MSIVESIRSVFVQYATFSGRARRSEFWWFVFANWFVSSILSAVTFVPPLVRSTSNNGEAFVASAGSTVFGLCSLAVLIPALAVGARRLHDTNRSGWNCFMFLIPLAGPVILLYFLIQEGTSGSNSYGADPKT